MISFIKKRVGLIAFAMLATLCLPCVVMADGTLDTTNFTVDITQFVATVAQAFGALVGAVVAVYFLIQIVRGGMRWIRTFATR